MDHLKELILQLEREKGVRQTRLRRTYNGLVGGKQLVGAFHNKSKGKPDVYRHAFTDTNPPRPQNCEEVCKDTSSKFFLLRNSGMCGCAKDFNEEHGATEWEWNYTNKGHGGSPTVNIVYEMKEEEPPTMLGCARIGRKPRKITTDILPAECAVMVKSEQFAVTPRFTSVPGNRMGRPACYPYSGKVNTDDKSCGPHGNMKYAAVYSTKSGAAVKIPAPASRGKGLGKKATRSAKKKKSSKKKKPEKKKEKSSKKKKKKSSKKKEKKKKKKKKRTFRQIKEGHMVLRIDAEGKYTYVNKNGRIVENRNPTVEDIPNEDIQRVLQADDGVDMKADDGVGTVLVEFNDETKPSQLVDVGTDFKYVRILPNPKKDAQETIDEHGFVVLKGALPTELCERVLEENIWGKPDPIFGVKWPTSTNGDPSRKVLYAEKVNLTQWNVELDDTPGELLEMNNTELNFALRAQKALNKDYRRLNEGQIFPQDVKVGKSELPATKEVQTRILNIVRRIISCRHAPKQPVTLISPKEQRRQYAHRDYNQRICRRRRIDDDDFHPMFEASRSSYGIIVALQQDTRFVCWPGSHRGIYICSCGGVMDKQDNKTFKCDSCEQTYNPKSDACPLFPPVRTKDAAGIVIQPGDVLLFVDTLVHAGSSYDDENKRIHFYCDDMIEARKCRNIKEKLGCETNKCIWLEDENQCVLRDPNFTEYAAEDSNRTFSTEVGMHKEGDILKYKGESNPMMRNSMCKGYVKGRGDGCKECAEPLENHITTLYDEFLQKWNFNDYKATDQTPYEIQST